MATVNKSCQLHSKAANGDVLKLYPNTLIANVDGLQSALDGKVNTVSGKGLSTNDYTTAEKNKLSGIAAGAQVNSITGVKGNTETTYRTGNVNITPANIGLGNVGNFKAVSTVASQGLSDTEKSNARANIGAGTSSFSGSYNDLSNKPTIPTKTSQLTNDSGYTTNTGTVTGVKVGSTSYSPSSGVVSLPAYPTTLPASDVSSWAKAANKPSYTYSEVGAAASSHTHNYAGSSSAGGAATSANKLNTDKGSATQPVYFSGGVPVATTYSLAKSVPADAKFTDTTYSAATQSASGLMSAADKIKLDGLTPGQITISAGSGFTISDVFSYKCNGLAWFSLMAKCSNQLLQGQSYKVATVDENTIKRGDPVVVLNAYVNGTSIPINGYMPQWSTQEINVVSESNNIPANSSIFISGVYRFY